MKNPTEYDGVRQQSDGARKSAVFVFACSAILHLADEIPSRSNSFRIVW